MTTHKVNDVLAVKAAPHKRFFIDMITRDISLDACVLDLIDNSVDGATRATEGKPNKAKAPKPNPLSLFRLQLVIFLQENFQNLVFIAHNYLPVPQTLHLFWLMECYFSANRINSLHFNYL